nr:DUF4158 domain-containing protein [Bacillus cereus]
MVTRELLTSSQRGYFYEIPECMDQREIVRYYTISDEELKVMNKQCGAANRLGFAIQIAYLRFPGRPLSANEKVPDFIIKRMKDTLKGMSSISNSFPISSLHSYF